MMKSLRRMGGDFLFNGGDVFQCREVLSSVDGRASGAGGMGEFGDGDGVKSAFMPPGVCEDFLTSGDLMLQAIGLLVRAAKSCVAISPAS